MRHCFFLVSSTILLCISQFLTYDAIFMRAIDYMYDDVYAAINGSSVVFHVDDVDLYSDNFFLSYTLIVQGTYLCFTK